MGDNFKAAGFSSVKKFVSAMSRSESEQLKAFVNFVKTNKPMLSALKKKDWEKFASLYNGKKYKDNKYDEKLNSAYLKFSSPSKVPIKKS